MKLKRSDCVEWPRKECLQEEVFISFLQAHSSALLPGALCPVAPARGWKSWVAIIPNPAGSGSSHHDPWEPKRAVPDRHPTG